ncbi:MAG TPA: cation diffusion facilitator family transporter [Candidatus Polarisedimenticolaceae bacterium]|nr:cation diffusion facilitator family transporter [Candidatus Polarisedimenticolaceae bacterium]
MGHGHPHPEDSRAASVRLAWVLALTAAYMVVELVGGLLSHSLALLADAGHMLTDVLALALALAATRWATRPPDRGRTYGYQRAEILAALINGAALAVLCSFLLVEAIERLRRPAAVDVPLMAGVAAGGLLVNLAGSILLHGGRGRLNVRAAYLHVLGDLLGSVGALLAAGALAAFGWSWADPVAGVLIAGILAVSAVRLVLESVHVLMEGAPPHLDLGAVARCLRETAGVAGVHDLHVWSLGGRTPLLTAHLVLDHTLPPAHVLRGALRALRERFSIEHATLQIEPADFNILEGSSVVRR